MAEKQSPRSQRLTTPEDYPVSSSGSALPSGDYSYVLEVVMNMQNTMGKVSEAVDSLKTQSKEQGQKLDKLGNDVHAAKVVMGVVAAIIVGAAGFLGWSINLLIQYLSSHPAK